MNTQQRTILSKARRLSAMDAEWDESKHPRAENGRFGSGSLKDGKVNFPELSVSEIEALAKTPIAVTSEMGQGARKSAVKEWLRSNLQGKSVTASDGNRIYFTRNDTVSHISFNSQRSHLIAQCVPHLAAVFAEGEAVGFQESSHDRKDKSIIGFQVYRKQITLADGYQVRIEAHAAKREEGYLEFAAYTLKKAPASDGYSSTDIAENSTRIPDSPPDARAGVKDNRSGADDSGEAVRHVEYGLSSADNHTPAQNQMQGCEYAAYADKKIDSKSKKVGNAPASIETAKDSGQAAGFVSYADNHTHFAEDGQAHETFEYAAYAHKKIDSKSEKGSQNLHANDAADSIRKLEFGSTAFKANPTPAADSDDGENNTAPAEDEEPEKTAEDEAPEAPEGGAPKPAQDAAISKMAMDAAIQKAVAAERKRAQALAAAQREVAHIVGDVAMDNAADVYKFALEQSGIDVTGVHPSAYRAMVGMLGKPKQPMAQDMAKTAEQFPSLSRIRKA